MEPTTGIFDSHAHYDDPAFDPDREERLAAIHRGGVEAIMTIGADLPTSRAAVELAQSHDYIWAAVGVHPHGAAEVPADWLGQLEELAAHPRVKAIGEIGYDYHYDGDWKEAQKTVFEEQLKLAELLCLPVIIHDREAHGDTMELLRRYRPAGVVHCYSGSAEMAKEILSLGMYVGFTGMVTFKNARRALEAAAVVPLDRLLVETDCPYMAPEPFRGKRCDSALLPYTIAKLAEVKGVSPQELADITNENARRLFDIPREEKYRPCPCCGCLTMPQPLEDCIGDICPVCFWEIDFPGTGPDDPSGCNHGLTLRECRANYRRFGACEERMLPHVRPPREEELP